MGWYERHVFPAVLDVLLSSGPVARLRAELLSELRGDVLEIGFGTGLNVPHYPAAVGRLIALEPNGGMGRRAARRVAASPLAVTACEARGERIPLPDASVDAVVSTFTLCSIPALETAFAEVRRVLRPGGALWVLEHGRHPDEGVRRWQRRLAPINRVLGCGCHIDRDIQGEVERGGFTFERIRELDLSPRAFSHLTVGCARPAFEGARRDVGGAIAR